MVVVERTLYLKWCFLFTSLTRRPLAPALPLEFQGCRWHLRFSPLSSTSLSPDTGITSESAFRHSAEGSVPLLSQTGQKVGGQASLEFTEWGPAPVGECDVDSVCT